MLLAAWQIPDLGRLAHQCDDRDVAAVAANAAKEARVQWRQARDWVVRFGDGTDESRRRLLAAIDAQWPLCPEMLATPMAGAKRGSQRNNGPTPWLRIRRCDRTDARAFGSIGDGGAAVGNARLARAELLA